MKNYVSGFVLGVLLTGLVVTGNAQAPSALPKTPEAAQTSEKPEALTDTENVMVQLLVAQAKLANNECNAIDSMKTFIATRTDVIARIETNHAGYTLDLQTGKLVAKKK